jgi:hypothetical protein
MNQSSPGQTLCPRCGRFKTDSISLSHVQRGIVFQGCSDCLIGELDVLATHRAAQCSTCGSAKSVTLFGNGVQRLECPVHVQGRGLLGKTLQVLTRLHDHGSPFPGDVEDLIVELRKALGVQSA